MHHVPGRCAPFGRCPWTDVVVHAPRPRCRTSGKGVRFQRSGCRTANGQGVVFGRHIQNGTFKSSILWMRAIFSSNFFGWVFTSAGEMRIMASPETVDNFQMMLEINSNPPVKKSHLKGGQAQISKIFPEGVHLIAHLLIFPLDFLRVMCIIELSGTIVPDRR